MTTERPAKRRKVDAASHAAINPTLQTFQLASQLLQTAGNGSRLDTPPATPGFAPDAEPSIDTMHTNIDDALWAEIYKDLENIRRGASDITNGASFSAVVAKMHKTSALAAAVLTIDATCAHLVSIPKKTAPPAPPPRVSNGPANFLDLPAELRNKIYSLAVENAKLTMINTKWDQRPPPPVMLLVSRQVRAEYKPVLFSQARLVSDCTARPPFPARWLRYTTAKRIGTMKDYYDYWHSAPSAEFDLAQRVATDRVFVDMFDPLRTRWSRTLPPPQDDYDSDSDSDLG